MNDDPKLVAAAELLTSHVSSGKSYTPDIEGLKTLVPKDCRMAPAFLYRTVTVTKLEHERLGNEGSLTIKGLPFSSWTSSLAVAVRHARGLLKSTGDLVALVIERPIPSEHVIANVEAVFRAVGWDHPDVEEWELYASKEKEFIVEMNSELSLVRSADCRCIFLDHTDPSLHPSEGDQVWSQDDGVFLEVDELKVHMVEAGKLTFHVTLSDETESQISWDSTHLCWNLDGRISHSFTP